MTRNWIPETPNFDRWLNISKKQATLNRVGAVDRRKVFIAVVQHHTKSVSACVAVLLFAKSNEKVRSDAKCLVTTGVYAKALHQSIMLHFHNAMQERVRKDLSNLPLFTKVSKSLADPNRLRDGLGTANVYFQIAQVRAKLEHAHVLFEDLVRIWEEEIKEGWQKINTKKGITNASASSSPQPGPSPNADAPATSSQPGVAGSTDAPASSAEGGSRSGETTAAEKHPSDHEERAVSGEGIAERPAVEPKEGELQTDMEQEIAERDVNAEGKALDCNTSKEKGRALMPQVADEQLVARRLAAVGLEPATF